MVSIQFKVMANEVHVKPFYSKNTGYPLFFKLAVISF